MRFSGSQATSNPPAPPTSLTAKNFLLTLYHSPAGELSAYLTPDPKDNKKHPAIVWAHSFSCGISNSFWQPTEDGYNLTARAFREKGIVMMCPSWRGENENPGRIELLYGEVDDFVAAIEHIKKLPYVDPQRVYIGGHNTGGTLTLLTASANDQFCAAFSIGGMLDGVATLKKAKRDELPFNPDSERDFQLRNPMRYAAFIRRPVFYFEADVHFDKNAAGQMQSRANSHFQAFHLDGTHFDILHPVTQLIAEKIAANKELKFTEEELMKSYRLSDFNDRQALLSGPSNDDHGLSAVLAKAETEAGNQIKLSVSDVKIIQNALMVFNEQKDCSPKTMATVVKLANLRGRNMAGQVVHEFDMALAQWFSEWAMLRLKVPGKLSKEEAAGLFGIVSAVAYTPLPNATDLVVAAMRRGIMADKKLSWSNLLLNAYNFKGSQTEYFLRNLTGDPPSGQMGDILLHYIDFLIKQGWEGVNPFNSRKGFAILKAWVENKNSGEYLNALSAVRAAVYIDAEFRDALIDLGFQHADKRIRVLAAWADAKSGGSRGIPLLKQACLDADVSASAQGYLKNLLRENEIPPEATDPKKGNIAKAVISGYLMDPSQLGERPLSIDVYDYRTIFWPPTQEKCEFWLLKFTFQPKDGNAPKTGYGCYSKPVTWYNYKGNMKSDIPEDLYLHTCAPVNICRAQNGEANLSPWTRPKRRHWWPCAKTTLAFLINLNSPPCLNTDNIRPVARKSCIDLRLFSPSIPHETLCHPLRRLHRAHPQHTPCRRRYSGGFREAGQTDPC